MHHAPFPGPQAAPAPYAAPAPQVLRPVLLPEAPSLYRTGRAIARFIAVIGWVLALLLPVVAVAFLITQRPLLMAVTPVSSGLKPVLFVVVSIIAAALAALPGLLMVFSAQMARAVFHTSIATQDLAAIERARNAAGR